MNSGQNYRDKNMNATMESNATSGPAGVGENGGTNINVIESIVESFNYQVNDEKRKQKVCVHWLKQACRKGDSCEYLHRWIEDRIPICKFFQ